DECKRSCELNQGGEQQPDTAFAYPLEGEAMSLAPAAIEGLKACYWCLLSRPRSHPLTFTQTGQPYHLAHSQTRWNSLRFTYSAHATDAALRGPSYISRDAAADFSIALNI